MTFSCKNFLFGIYILITGRQVDGIWHTAVVVFGREYFYGIQGITSCSPVSFVTLKRFCYSCGNFPVLGGSK